MMLQQPITNSFETNGKLQERNEKCNKELSRSFETEVNSLKNLPLVYQLNLWKILGPLLIF